MDWQTVLTPWNIGGAVFGVLVGIAVIISLVMNRRQIATALARGVQRLFSPVGFFALVIVVFMIVSILESGQFFNDDITHGAIFGLLGYALALGFDLVSVVCMTARLNATRMRDERGARLNLMGVCVCAAVSAFANVAAAVQGYRPANLDHTPAFIQVCAPWTAMVFPLLIVILSMTTDHILDHTPARDIDINVYRARERKRVEVLQIRLMTERELLALDTELSTLRRKREQASGRVRREWFFWKWLRPVVPSSAPEKEQAPDQTVLDQAVQAALAEHFDQVNTNLHTLNRLATEMHAHLSQMRTQERAHNAQVNTQDTDQEHRPGRQPAHLHARRAQSAPAHLQPGGLDQGAETGEGASAETQILAAFQHLGRTAHDTDVARETGYSRTTVARWKKRLIAQGQLSALLSPQWERAIVGRHGSSLPADVDSVSGERDAREESDHDI